MRAMKRIDFTDAAGAAWSQRYPKRNLTSFSPAQRLLWSGRVIEAILDRAAKEQRFKNRGDFEVAAVIRRTEPDLPTAIEVATALTLSPSGMTGRLDRLENQGYLVRQSDRRDRRVIRLELTPQGQKAVDGAFAANAAIYDRIFANMSERDQVQIDKLLGPVLNNLDELKDQI